MSTPKQSSEPQTFTISYSPGDTSVDITLESCEVEEGGRKVMMMMTMGMELLMAMAMRMMLMTMIMMMLVALLVVKIHICEQILNLGTC